MSSKGYCAFRDHGLNVTFNGEIIPCPALRDCMGLFGNVLEGDVEKNYRKMQNILSKFYKVKGSEPCLRRHKHHSDFLKFVKENTKN